MIDELQKIAEGEWASDDFGGWRFDGEHADGEPSWNVYPLGSGYCIRYEWGWYVQEGDAINTKEVIVVTNAMKAAARALEAALFEGGER